MRGRQADGIAIEMKSAMARPMPIEMTAYLAKPFASKIGDGAGGPAGSAFFTEATRRKVTEVAVWAAGTFRRPPRI